MDSTQEELLLEVTAYAAEYEAPPNAVTTGDIVDAMADKGIDMSRKRALRILKNMVKKGLLQGRKVNRRWYFFKE